MCVYDVSVSVCVVVGVGVGVGVGGCGICVWCGFVQRLSVN